MEGKCIIKQELKFVPKHVFMITSPISHIDFIRDGFSQLRWLALDNSCDQ